MTHFLLFLIKTPSKRSTIFGAECNLSHSYFSHQNFRKMDEFLDEMDCRYRSDSIMMKLLRSAMDKAYEKVQSKDGPIECLHERSKFYELAIIQIKGCHSLIQEETDSCIPESSREKMLMDLIELQDLLQARLKEMKTSIKEKDKELTERLKNEFKLKQALELKERELLRLRANIEIDRTKTESFQDFIVNFEANNEDEAKEGEICDLKNSIDQQVLNIKQRLKKTASNAVDYEFDNEMLDEERFKYSGSNEDDLCNGDEYCLENKDLSSDSLRPEQNMVIQQMSSDIDILEGTLKIAFGRMQSAEVRPLEEQLRWTIEKETASILIKGFIQDLKQNFVDPSGLPNEHLMELIDEMTRLRGELETLSRNESMAKRDKGNDYSSDTRSLIVRTSSEPLPEFDYMEEQPEEDLAAEGSNYVAKLIKNHESFIKRQQKKLHSLKKEGFGGKGGCSPAERGKEESKFTERRIREVVERLDSVTKWKDKLRAKIPACPRDEKRRSGNVEKRKSRICYDKELIEERKKVKQERDESELQALAMEETYIVLCKGLMEDSNLELCNYDTESFISEEICFIICREAVKDFGTSKDSALEEYRNFYLLSKLRDDICTIFTREMVGEFNKTMQSYASESLVNEEIYQEIYRIAFEETIKYIRSVAYLEISKQQDLTENVESLLKEDVYMVVFREIVGGLKIEKEGYEFENYIREDIYQFIIVAAVNEALNKDYGSKDLLSDKNLDKSSNASGEGSLNQQLDSISTCLGSTNIIKEQISQCDLVILKREELDKCGTIELLREDETSKELPKDLECSLGIGFDNSEKEYDQKNLSMDVVQEKEQSLAKPENNQLVQICPLDFVLSPIIRFQELLVDFESMVQEKLQRNHLRYSQKLFS